MARIEPVRPVSKPGTSTSGKPNQGNGKSNTKKQPPKKPNSVWDVAKRNIKGWADIEAKQFKEHPFLKTGAYISGAAGFIPGAAGTAASGVEAYLNTKAQGGTEFEARRNAALTSAATLGLGKLANVGGKALAKTKVGKTVVNKVGEALNDAKAGIDNILNPHKLAPTYAYNYTPNSVMNKVKQGIKGEGTSHNIVKENLPKMEGGYVVDVSSNSIKQVGKNGELKDTGIKGDKFVNNFRENELKDKLSLAGYDLTPGGKYINKDGTLTDSAWLTLEGEYVAPYLYQSQLYEHISPDDLPSNVSLDRKYRGKQEPDHFIESKGGDLGGGGYVGKSKWEEEYQDPNYLFDLYSRDSYTPTRAIISAPHEDYFINSNDYYTNLNPYVKANYLRFIKDAGSSEQQVLDWLNNHGNYDRPLYRYTEKLKDPMIVNDLLTRKYGIPGFKDPTTVQAAIGDEGLNTYVKHSYRVPHEDRIQAAIDDDMFVKDHSLFDSDGDFMKNLNQHEEKALRDAGILTEQPVYNF